MALTDSTIIITRTITSPQTIVRRIVRVKSTRGLPLFPAPLLASLGSGHPWIRKSWIQLWPDGPGERSLSACARVPQPEIRATEIQATAEIRSPVPDRAAAGLTAPLFGAAFGSRRSRGRRRIWRGRCGRRRRDGVAGGRIARRAGAIRRRRDRLTPFRLALHLLAVLQQPGHQNVDDLGQFGESLRIVFRVERAASQGSGRLLGRPIDGPPLFARRARKFPFEGRQMVQKGDARAGRGGAV